MNHEEGKAGLHALKAVRHEAVVMDISIVEFMESIGCIELAASLHHWVYVQNSLGERVSHSRADEVGEEKYGTWRWVCWKLRGCIHAEDC